MAVSTRIISTLLLLSAASLQAQAPTVTLTKSPQKTEISIRHPNVLTSVNWNTFRFWINGIDSTSALLSLLFSPKFPVDVETNELKISILLDLSAFPMAEQACSLKDGKCGDSFRRIRNGSCYPKVDCTNEGKWLPNWVNTNATTYSILGVPITRRSGFVLSSLAAIGHDPRREPTFPWSWYAFSLNIWRGNGTQTARSFFDASPLSGNHIKNLPLAVSPTPFNGDYYITFAPKPGGHILLPAGDYVVAIKAQINNPRNNTALAFRHSIVQGFGQPDLAMTNRLIASKPLTDFGYRPGIAAIDIYGY